MPLRWTKEDSALFNTEGPRPIHREIGPDLYLEGDLGRDARRAHRIHGIQLPIGNDDSKSSDDWRLTPETSAAFFRSATFSYVSRRHIDRVGD